MLVTVAFAALVSYVSPDGVYLNEGKADGVQVGDVVRIGRRKLKITLVSDHRARTEPPKKLFGIKVGAKAKIKRSGKRAKKAAKIKPRKAVPPQFKASQTAAWWTQVADTWTTPRPVPKTEAAPEPESHWSGALGVRAASIGTENYRRSWQTLYSTLAYQSTQWAYDHDFRLRQSSVARRYPPPQLEVRRLEGRYLGENWDLRAGRLSLGESLVAGPLDGAAINFEGGRVFVGALPDELGLDPTLIRPMFGASTQLDHDFGEVQTTMAMTAALILFDGQIDRTALAPSFSLRTDAFRLRATAELDVYLNDKGDDRPALDPTRLYTRLSYRYNDWLDVGLRYQRSQPYPRRIATPYRRTAQQSGWADLKLDAGNFGYLVPSVGLYDERDGHSIIPGIDYGVALATWLDLHAGWFRRDAPNIAIDNARARLIAHPQTNWPLSIELGGRMVLIHDRARPSLDEEEWTNEAGLRWSIPKVVDLVLTAEYTDAVFPRTLVFGDLRWRFGE